jgi:molecular chaperone GrpE
MIDDKDKDHEQHKPAPSDLRSTTEHADTSNGTQEQITGDIDTATTDKITSLEAENKELQDRLLRALAETENVRKRSERDVSNARQYAVTEFARDMASVADNLDRAVSAIPDDVRRDEGPIKTLIEGVELTEKELLRSLEKHGVRKLNPAGEAFDPNFHEAIFETEDPSVPHGTVTLVAEPGYSIGARPLRPAKVGVSRGGPARGPQS